ncbi:hypothetical protein QR685DRAFT_544608 [Neurospora intermedia]|uniref:Uncharacterized protein n=1 Tax=Neurospora intermedia TaxID=5142 RepID=A0ABR3DEE0_NEUIN
MLSGLFWFTEKGRENDDDEDDDEDGEMDKALVQLRWLDKSNMAPEMEEADIGFRSSYVADADPPLVLVTCSSSRRPQEEGMHCTNSLIPHTTVSDLKLLTFSFPTRPS